MAVFLIRIVKNYNFVVLLYKNWSKITIAAIDSTIGTALGNTQASCLPLALKVVELPS